VLPRLERESLQKRDLSQNTRGVIDTAPLKTPGKELDFVSRLVRVVLGAMFSNTRSRVPSTGEPGCYASHLRPVTATPERAAVGKIDALIRAVLDPSNRPSRKHHRGRYQRVSSRSSRMIRPARSSRSSVLRSTVDAYGNARRRDS